MALAFIGLGSNLGDREGMIHLALSKLQAMADVKILALSAIYESDALLPDNAPPEWDMPFYNAVAAVETGLMAHTLFAALQHIETVLGRKKEHAYWSPREIDCDLLAYDDHVLIGEQLTLPHAAILSRDFVLLPWRDIAPDWKYPVPGAYHHKTIAQLCDRLETVTARKVEETAVTA